MTNCRADRRRLGRPLAVLLLAPWFAVGAASAQVGPPIRLTPPPRSDAPSAPAPAAPERARPGAIEIERARPVDFDAIGLGGPSRGGLPPDIWERSDSATIDRLLGALPGGFTSKAARDLTRRLLASAAAPPRGSTPGTTPSEGDRASFASRRAERLMATGDVAAAIDLAKALPARLADEGAARVQLDGLWLAGDNDAACAYARGQGARYVTAYWLKSGIFCQMLAGERGRAQLGLNLLREQGQEDPAFVRLALAVGTTSSQAIGAIKDPMPLTLAMLRATRQPLTAEFARTAPVAMLPSISASPDTVIDVRLAAGERALAYGAIAPESLAALYDSVDLRPNQVANAGSFAASDKGPRGRAALYRSAKEQTLPVAKAEALRRLWSSAAAPELRSALWQLGAPLVRTLNPSAELAWFADDAARVLLVAGDVDAARVWAASARFAPGQAQGAADERGPLWPVLRLAGGDSLAPWEPGRLAAWRQSNDKLPREAADSRRAILATLFAALGEPAAPQLAPDIDAAGPIPRKTEMPHPALWLAMLSAASDRRTGEAALAALVVVGTEGAAEGNLYSLGAALAALKSAGFEREARALAAEAAIASGL